MVDQIEENGKFQSEQDINAFIKYIKNLSPPPETTDQCLDKITNFTGNRKDKFMNICTQIMNADNFQHPAEFNLIMQFRDRIYN